jgi:hypothetical protein
MNELPSKKAVLIGVGVGVVLLAIVVVVAVSTGPTRASVRTYAELISAANQGDLAAAKRLCSQRYLASHPLDLAREGGIVSLPRNIHKNFKVWRSGANVWLCPTNRGGPIYQFVRENAEWRFDGPVGILHYNGVVEPMEDSGAAELPDDIAEGKRE